MDSYMANWRRGEKWRSGTIDRDGICEGVKDERKDFGVALRSEDGFLKKCIERLLDMVHRLSL